MRTIKAVGDLFLKTINFYFFLPFSVPWLRQEKWTAYPSNECSEMTEQKQLLFPGETLCHLQ